MTLLAKSAVSYLEANTLEVAFAQFVDPKSRFIRGDLFVSVFDLAGNCYAYGADVEKIWDTLLTVKVRETPVVGHNFQGLLHGQGLVLRPGPLHRKYQKCTEESNNRSCAGEPQLVIRIPKNRNQS